MPVFGRARHLTSARRLRRDEDGAALLELTVIMPFLIVLGLGLFEFSNMLYQYHLITGGVRDAGRFAAGLPKPDPIVTTDTTCDGDPITNPIGCAKLLAVTGQIASDEGPKRVSWWDVDDIVVDYVALDPPDPDLRGGNPFKVVVFTEIVYDDLGFLNALGLGPITIATSHEERHYGIR
jgi:hypothetical protein